MVEHLLVRWSGDDSHVVTWENEQELRRRFPDSAAWGQAAPEGGGDVTAATSVAGSSKQKPAAQPVNRPRREKQPNSRFPASVWTK